MGMDIHGPFIERLMSVDDVGSEWWRPVADLYFPRDYVLFSMLSDVIREGNDCGRGRPPYACATSTHDASMLILAGGDADFGHAWMLLPAARRVVGKVRAFRSAHPNNGWYDPRTDIDTIMLAVSIMEFVESTTGCKTRMLYCYDN
jgi:hypothetical protein